MGYSSFLADLHPGRVEITREDFWTRVIIKLTNSKNLNPAIIHRDIKPSNVILTSDGEVKLIDLNAAKVYQPEKTEDTALLGTVGYAAPEQYGFGVSNAQADIYAVGILLNEMILGVPPKSAIPDGRIGNIIRKCTMMDPKDRYSTVEDLIADLNRKTPGIAPDSNPSGQSKFRIPGFRTGNTSLITAGIIGYSFIFFLGLTLKVQEAKSAVGSFRYAVLSDRDSDRLHLCKSSGRFPDDF